MTERNIIDEETVDEAIDHLFDTHAKKMTGAVEREIKFHLHVNFAGHVNVLSVEKDFSFSRYDRVFQNDLVHSISVFCKSKFPCHFPLGS